MFINHNLASPSKNIDPDSNSITQNLVQADFKLNYYIELQA